MIILCFIFSKMLILCALCNSVVNLGSNNSKSTLQIKRKYRRDSVSGTIYLYILPLDVCPSCAKHASIHRVQNVYYSSYPF
jgi:translation initiation factor 2 beta subunit (eIF-2beta)/eIF-5